MTSELTLQVNTSGAWKNCGTFSAARRGEVLAAVRPLANIMGETASWCLLHGNGEREYLFNTIVDVQRRAQASQSRPGLPR